MATGVDERPVRIVDAPLAPPAENLGLLSVFKRRYLLKLLVQREISGRYSNSILGVFWSYINPLTQFCVYWLFMGKIMGADKGMDNYPVHLFAGLVIVHFFTETFGAGTRSLLGNKGLLKKMAMPKEMFPVASMLVSLYHLVPASIILVIVCLLGGWTPTWTMIPAFLLALGIVMALGTALALVFSLANVFFRDFGSAVNILTNYIRFGVPMMYPFSMIEAFLGDRSWIYLLNPIADAVLLFQQAFWVGATPNPEATAVKHLPENLWLFGLGAFGASLVLLVIAQVIFSKYENKIPERLT
ncbi:ABC transporter permease [Nocardioides sp. WG-D5]|uniref:ABC transporter permease n=1 Tax=Nocardioides luteus TaxID=1844 RepID=UPI00020293E1|nr:ABC transporter permease [Nocardioides luteus]EGD42089.1 O-antigen export system permease protein [Nocardioidaceae bacterium Broad-1]MBG6094840.1 ABC-2 type transport system permease protein [Nocardioides luteus]